MNEMHDATQILMAAYQKRVSENKEKEALRLSGLDPIFEEQTPEVPLIKKVTQDIVDQCADMLVFARHNSYLSLAGLAANQLGKFGERVQLNACFINRGWKQGWTVALNPQVISSFGSTTNSREGCLTWPKKKILADRKQDIVVSYTDICGEGKEERVQDFEAIVWQHEINHLRGIPEFVVDPEKKQKPNERCQCGSGKKFKKCCGK